MSKAHCCREASSGAVVTTVSQRIIGVLPQSIEIHHYDANRQPDTIESYKPEYFLPKTMLGGTENVDGT